MADRDWRFIEMKYYLEILEEKTEISFGKKRKLFVLISSTEFPDCKIRVIEFRNDEPDETRTACKVIE